MLQKKMAKSTNRVHSRHFKEASSATFLRRSYLSISLKMTSFPAAVRSSLQNERASFGNTPNATREVTEEEQEKLFETRQFGDHDPLVLQRTFWWFLSLHFDFRARDESRKLCWGDVLQEKDPEQAENFSFNGRREDQKQGKAAVKLATDDLSLQSSSLQVMPDAR